MDFVGFSPSFSVNFCLVKKSHLPGWETLKIPKCWPSFLRICCRPMKRENIKLLGKCWEYFGMFWLFFIASQKLFLGNLLGNTAVGAFFENAISKSEVGLKEFQNLLETYQFRSYLQTRGIDIKNAETFFKMLVELQGEPTIDAITFANACVRMKGAATSIDLQTVMFTTHLMNKEQRRAFQFMCLGSKDDASSSIYTMMTIQ